MALADIISKIKSEAEREAEGIRAEARQEADRIRGNAEEEARKLRDTKHTANVSFAESSAMRISSNAAHRARLTREEKRVEVMRHVFEEARTLLENLSEKTHADFVQKKIAPLLSKKGSVTVSAEREKETRDALAAAGYTGVVTVAPKGALMGGFILETNDALYDYSFATLLVRAQEGSSAALARALFDTHS